MSETEVKRKSRYSCGRCGREEAYRAKDNEAPYAHLCAADYFELDARNRLMYAPVPVVE